MSDILLSWHSGLFARIMKYGRYQMGVEGTLVIKVRLKLM